MTLPNDTRFETLGEFHVARVNGRRVLAFLYNSPDGRTLLGASPIFSRKQAFDRATRTRPVPAAPTMGETLVRMLKAKGFPVCSESDELDDVTGELIAMEVMT